ncbi:DUF6415 family natural product biosynthesis protein [Streptomyces sp. NBC_00347]|uniref:DUF6415 family natural product biosynthesis protein n=1 Tax=Streptomyces sp. NBC_00347 TaxID=2975721 RepID=UPI002250B651|nr:DUF6415 family natural product biosynthesis protein [Streptomyces sp. NBC_00347]MCX5129472.1 DUF6415 family natural product biosynthesis protein [Streptomyces sp. NBC_00347]
MTVLVQAHPFQVVSEVDADPGLPIDTVVISESVSIILEPREILPSTALLDLWMSWLSGHFAVLLPSLAAPSSRPPESTDDQLIVGTVDFVRRALERGLPEEAEAAYVQLQELARTCRFLLGLANDVLHGNR